MVHVPITQTAEMKFNSLLAWQPLQCHTTVTLTPTWGSINQRKIRCVDFNFGILKNAKSVSKSVHQPISAVRIYSQCPIIDSIVYPSIALFVISHWSIIQHRVARPAADVGSLSDGNGPCSGNPGMRSTNCGQWVRQRESDTRSWTSFWQRSSLHLIAPGWLV